MPHLELADAELFHQSSGDGDPVVCVNGGFSSSWQWMLTVPALETSNHVTTYDQRGHGQSTGAVGEDPFVHIDDLVTLIETLHGGPVHLVTASGGSICGLHLLERRPDLVRSLNMHEPPSLGLLEGTAREAGQDILTRIWTRLTAGEVEHALAGFFADTGMDWAAVPKPMRDATIANAPHYLGGWFGDTSHPFWSIDADAIRPHIDRLQLTVGSDSPAFFHQVARALESALPGLEAVEIADAGHGAAFEQTATYNELAVSFIEGRS